MAARRGKTGTTPAGPPVYIVTRAQARMIDRLANERFGVPSIVLMENAAINATDVAFELLGDRPGPVLVFCGPGNNGGDGMAMARHLHNAGVPIAVALSSPQRDIRGDALIQARTLRAMRLPLGVATAKGVARLISRLGGRPTVVVDALLGTGARGAPRDALATAIRAINQLGDAGATVLAVDVPSGLDADSGQAAGAVVRADVTVTFVGLKPGFLAPDAGPLVGAVVVADIGVPRGLVESVASVIPIPGGRLTRGRLR